MKIVLINYFLKKVYLQKQIGVKSNNLFNIEGKYDNMID